MMAYCLVIFTLIIIVINATTPTSLPSSLPTLLPSTTPTTTSTATSHQPSHIPTLTFFPSTYTPTIIPSITPTHQPSFTRNPTSLPTEFQYFKNVSNENELRLYVKNDASIQIRNDIYLNQTINIENEGVNVYIDGNGYKIDGSYQTRCFYIVSIYKIQVTFNNIEISKCSGEGGIIYISTQTVLSYVCMSIYFIYL